MNSNDPPADMIEAIAQAECKSGGFWWGTAPESHRDDYRRDARKWVKILMAAGVLMTWEGKP